MPLSCRSRPSFMPQTFHRARRMRASMRRCSPASSTRTFWRRTPSSFRNPAMEAEAEDGPVTKSAQRKDLETALAAVARQFGEGLQHAVPVLLEGDPRECIPRLAEQNAPSIIVLGTQGRGRIERGIVGSVAERILRAANGPSLTVGPAVPACEPACAPFRRILFATGLSTAAARGAPLRSRHGARVRCIA